MGSLWVAGRVAVVALVVAVAWKMEEKNMKKKEKERQKAIEGLRSLLEKIEAEMGSATVYTILRHVSRSGMSRNISAFVIHENQPHNITYDVSKILDYKLAKNTEGVRVGGCGMDMGFHLVYSLSSSLYGIDDRGGYRLKHRWW